MQTANKFHDNSNTIATQQLLLNSSSIDSTKYSNTKKTTKDQYKCNICSNVFNKLDKLYRHIKDTGLFSLNHATTNQ